MVQRKEKELLKKARKWYGQYGGRRIKTVTQYMIATCTTGGFGKLARDNAMR